MAQLLGDPDSSSRLLLRALLPLLDFRDKDVSSDQTRSAEVLHSCDSSMMPLFPASMRLKDRGLGSCLTVCLLLLVLWLLG